MTSVCTIDDLVPDRGVCALVDGDHVAVFRLAGTGDLHAIDNRDPFCDVSVLSRGLVGSVRMDEGWVPYVASPLRKHRFDLRTGICLDDPTVSIDVWDVRTDGDRVVVGGRIATSAGNCLETAR